MASKDSKLPAASEDAPLPADARYHFDADKLKKFQTEAPWTKDPKYFDKVAISPSAVMKIMMHCQSGVEKGIAKGGTSSSFLRSEIDHFLDPTFLTTHSLSHITFLTNSHQETPSKSWACSSAAPTLSPPTPSSSRTPSPSPLKGLKPASWPTTTT
jgi:hypothetical protein